MVKPALEARATAATQALALGPITKLPQATAAMLLDLHLIHSRIDSVAVVARLSLESHHVTARNWLPSPGSITSRRSLRLLLPGLHFASPVLVAKRADLAVAPGAQ